MVWTEAQTCVSMCVCANRGKDCACDRAFVNHAVAYSVTVRERAEARGRPTSIKKALSVECVSQWAVELPC